MLIDRKTARGRNEERDKAVDEEENINNDAKRERHDVEKSAPAPYYCESPAQRLDNWCGSCFYSNMYSAF